MKIIFLILNTIKFFSYPTQIFTITNFFFCISPFLHEKSIEKISFPHLSFILVCFKGPIHLLPVSFCFIHLTQFVLCFFMSLFCHHVKFLNCSIIMLLSSFGNPFNRFLLILHKSSSFEMQLSQ
jgi:hypothetical protein